MVGVAGDAGEWGAVRKRENEPAAEPVHSSFRAESLVTTSRIGGAATGAISAAISLASRLDRWKKRGRISSTFSREITLAICARLVTQSRPSARGSITSG